MAKKQLTPEQRECRNAQRRLEHARNPEKSRGYQRKSYVKNLERERARCKAHAATDKAQESARRRSKIWRKATPERIEKERAQKREYYQKNRAKLLDRAIQWAQDHSERAVAKAKAWNDAHPDVGLARTRNRRARIRNLGGRHTAADVLLLFEKQMGKCAACEIVVTKTGKGKYHVDHVMPVSRGGSNGPENLQLLCPTCNHRKSNKHPDEWAKIISRANSCAE